MAAQVEQNRRSAATRPPPPVNARALTAAGQKLDPTNTREAALVKSYRQDWQHDAWAFYRLLPEIHFGHDYFRNVCSRVRIYPGYQADPDDAPAPLDDLDTDAELPEGAKPAEVAAAIDEMRRLDQGYIGGLSALTGDFGINIGLVGEGFLHGTLDDESPTGERFAVYSTEEMKATDGGYEIYRKGSSQGKAVLPDDFVMRAWRRLAQYRDLADAPMMALLSTCDTLRMLNQVLFASAASRAHGGIYKVPSEWSFPQRATDPNAQGQATDDPLNEQMMTAFTTPLTDPSSVGSVMPLLVRGPADTLDKGGWEDLGRGYGLELLKQIEGVRHSIAVGLDLPVEILEGVGSTNHWGAWQVALDTFKSHIEPLIQIICRALTDGYLWPAMRARNLDPTGFSVWYDPTALIGVDNDFDTKLKMHAAYALSDDALRRAGGASEDDAPDEAEIQRRIYIAQQLRVTERVTVAGGIGSSTLEPASDLADASPGTTAPPNPAQTTKRAPTQTPALTAAGSRRPLDALGPKLAQIDQDLRARIQTLADAALQRVLERAGTVVVRKMTSAAQQGGGRTRAARVRSELKGLKNAEITQHYGREELVALGLSEDKLIDGELGELEPEYRKLTKRALAAALLAGKRAVPAGDLDDRKITEVAHEQDKWVTAGFAVLSAAVLSAAHEQLFTPAQQPAGPGEIDLTARISPSAIAQSLGTAGGAKVAEVELDTTKAPTIGVAQGTLIQEAFQEALQILPQAWQWIYGYPDKEFEPHAVLDGVEFSSWEDDILLNDGDWPDVSYFRPSDHLGCSCGYVSMWAEDRPNDTQAGDNEPSEEGYP